ncbi:hypothetical protein DUNSADRAFT_1387 [Dunaliella salina]|uniref:Encoded protein n=1 Tax=Dunaliella salina TaxID=3046 RepID=A0ABQ7FXL7_DUNSA|nr:hypothetical protein DUNSADRAFT_1387 [Dunaliella salina]|eukprot:KAF5827067.1 hypothetical protein DUNSADRAFT_1387 [Dunaliella salina]
MQTFSNAKEENVCSTHRQLHLQTKAAQFYDSKASRVLHSHTFPFSACFFRTGVKRVCELAGHSALY